MNPTHEVRIRAVFAGLRRLSPHLVWASNSLSNIFLRLHEDRLEYRMFRAHTRAYDQVAQLDYRAGAGACNLVFDFGRPVTFIANCRTEADAHAALAFLAERGVSMGTGAQELLNADPSAQ